MNSETDIIAVQFDCDAQMFAWLADEARMAELRQKYPPSQYSARIDMFDKRVVVTALADGEEANETLRTI